MTKKRKLTGQQDKFCRNIVEGMSQIDAYREAGYKCATDHILSAAASRLFSDPRIKARIEELRKGAGKRTELTAAGLAERLDRIARAAELAALRRSEDGEEILEARDAADVARQAMMDAAKLLGLIVDRSKVESENVNFNVSDSPMSEEEWEAEFAEQDTVESPAGSPARLN